MVACSVRVASPCVSGRWVGGCLNSGPNGGLVRVDTVVASITSVGISSTGGSWVATVVVAVATTTGGVASGGVASVRGKSLTSHSALDSAEQLVPGVVCRGCVHQRCNRDAVGKLSEVVVVEDEDDGSAPWVG